MHLNLPATNELAQAIIDAVEIIDGEDELWMVLRKPGVLSDSLFRARIWAWEAVVIDEETVKLRVELETWDEYMERTAKAKGL